MNTLRTRQRRLKAFIGVGLILGAAILVAAFTPGPRQAAAQQPPTPAPKFAPGVFPFPLPPGPFNAIQQVLDFAPGASMPEHAYGGHAFLTVIEGPLTRVQGGGETILTTGQNFSVAPGSYHAISNRGSSRARLLFTVVLPPNTPAVIERPGAVIPTSQPVTAFLSSLPSIPQVPFSVIQLVVDFPPGALAPGHTHPGPALSTMIAGNVQLTTVGGVEVRQTPGQAYIDGAAAAVSTHQNIGRTTATFATTFFLPVGAPPAIPVAQTGPATTPPRTGDGGLLVNRSDSPNAWLITAGVFATALTLSAALYLLRRRPTGV